MNSPAERLAAGVLKSPLLRIVLIGALICMLQVPVLLIAGVIGERRATRDEAVAEVTGRFGGHQRIAGPWLVVPVERRSEERDREGRPVERRTLRHAWFLPETMSVEARLTAEIRHRGIYDVPVYRAVIKVAGRFQAPDFSEWGASGDDIRWEGAHIVLRVGDARAITERASFTLGTRQVEFLPGTGPSLQGAPGVHAPVRAAAGAEEFSLRLEFNGSHGLEFAPLSRETAVRMNANWPDPSFGGMWLPAEREVTAQGFRASWRIPFLGRNYPQAWIPGEGADFRIDDSFFGVRLLPPVDAYRLCERSVKYELLFLVLPFLALWLLEIAGGARLHALHYLLVGSALCLFYLLKLSLAEHLGFSAAYWIAASAVVAQVSLYCRAVLGTRRRAALVAALLALLYGYLHLTLVNQDYALLVGALGLFAALSITMWLTRAVDWSRAGSAPDPEDGRARG